MNFIKWFLIIAGMFVGVLMAWQHQVVVMAALLLGYAGCYELKWNRFQIVLESMFGGLATGLGLQIFIRYGIQDLWIPMIIAPMITWLVLRVIFYGIETKFTLSPNKALTQIRADQESGFVTRTGASAWEGNNSGIAANPDADGRHMRYTFFCVSEIAMGGPTFGEVVFSNACAFTNVGPSIGLSEDGRYAAMTLPSRGEWGLLIADLLEKRVYQSRANGFWEIDRIEKGLVYGRVSPLTMNSPMVLSIHDAIKSADELPMIEDDGWWVIDSEHRKPFPRYPVVSIASEHNTHRVMFVPDLKPYKQNPFARFDTPTYNVLVDDELLNLETKSVVATWVNGVSGQPVYDGRFLYNDGKILDFNDPINDVFNVKQLKILDLKSCDSHSYLSFGSVHVAGDALIRVEAIAMPLSTSFSAAEFNSDSYTHPWDEEEIEYWDASEKKCVQARTRIQRQLEYTINLDKYSQSEDLRSSVVIRFVNRANGDNSASVEIRNGTNMNGEYAAYHSNISCGIKLGSIIHETIWSHCGRYLAVVHFELPPRVPCKISILDFETSTIRELNGEYALPNFTWFDKTMLQFTHIAGISEAVIVVPGDNEEKTLRINEPEHTALPYDLLIGSIDNRRAELERKAAKNKTPSNYTSASVSRIAQHCILFAPNFDRPILQPPEHNLYEG